MQHLRSVKITVVVVIVTIHNGQVPAIALMLGIILYTVTLAAQVVVHIITQRAMPVIQVVQVRKTLIALGVSI